MATKESHGRIPLALQAVFLAGNRGEEVHVPPPGNAAFRVFQTMFSRGTKKPSTPAATEVKTTSRGFFGMQQNRLRRAASKAVIHETSTKKQERRTSAVPSCTDRTCPIRDISFQSEVYISPTRARQTSSTYRTKIIRDSMPDDISVASSVTCSVMHGVKKKTKTKKTKEEKVCMHESLF